MSQQSEYQTCVNSRVGCGNNNQILIGRRWLVLVALLASTLLGQVVSRADSTYVCTPSGFTLGLPPFRSAADVYLDNYIGQPLPLGKLQSRLAESLVQSKLFSSVTLMEDAPDLNATDVTLLVAVPVARSVSETDPPRYRFSFDVMLIENVGGRQLYHAQFDTLIEARYNRGIRDSHRFEVEMEVAFTQFVPRILVELNRVLNIYPDRPVEELHAQKTVRQSHREPIWLAPTIVLDPSPGLLNYAGYLKEQLGNRLGPKNCFQFSQLPAKLEDCWVVSTLGNLDSLRTAYHNCHPEWKGMIVLIILSQEHSDMQFRVVLLHSPDMQVLYDRTLITRPGWRLTNSIETHAAGIAQASHTVPH